jgi:hypothetical protein
MVRVIREKGGASSSSILYNKFNEVIGLEEKIYQLLLEMKKDISEIKETVNRIEVAQTEDVVGVLKIVSRNTKALDQDVEFLSKKVGTHEMILNRLGQN